MQLSLIHPDKLESFDIYSPKNHVFISNKKEKVILKYRRKNNKLQRGENIVINYNIIQQNEDCQLLLRLCENTNELKTIN